MEMEMATRLLVVLGATGLQGGSVIQTYLQRPEWRLRGITRDPSKPAARELREQGVEVVAADLNDVESLVRAFEGAEMIFAVTDFWAPFHSPASTATPSLSTPLNQLAYTLELHHGQNIALAASQHLPTLKHLIFSSLPSCALHSHGKFSKNLHFESKAAIYTHICDVYPALGAKTSQLFMGSYMRNFGNAGVGGVRREGARGVAGGQEEWVLEWPQEPLHPEPYVDTERDTGAFVVALEELGRMDMAAGKAAGGKKLFGVSDVRSGAGWMRVWSETVGVRGSYRQVSMAEFEKRVWGRLGLESGNVDRKGMGEGDGHGAAQVDAKDAARRNAMMALAEEVVQSRGFNAEFGWMGGEEGVLMPADVSLNLLFIIW